MDKGTENQMPSQDFSCPKCGCAHTTRIPVEFLDADTRRLWWCIAILLLLGVSVHPLILLLAFASAILSIIVGILGKFRSRSVWDMQCSRCGHEFSVPNPDAAARANARDAAQKARVEARLAESRRRFASEDYNGQLLADESLLHELSGLSYHRNAFSTVPYKIKCTNKGLLFYNASGSFRIPSSEILAIRKRSYFGLIPTGIQIQTVNPHTGKRRGYTLVAVPSERDSAIASMKAVLHHPISA